MPQPDNRNSNWNRRDEVSDDAGLEADSDPGLSAEEAEPATEADWYSQEIEDDAGEYDLSLKFEDFAPIWLQKLRSLYGLNPEWSVASTIGAIALVLTTILLMAMPVPPERPKTTAPEVEETVATKPALITTQVEEALIDTRVEIAPEAFPSVVLSETEPMLVSFGELQNNIVEHRPLEENKPRLSMPELNFPPAPPSDLPELALNVQKIRVIEREMLDPGIDEPFVVSARSTSEAMPVELEPADRLLFNERWTEINLARADQQTEPAIRPTLYHERFPGGEHVQVGREQPMEHSSLDRLTRVTTPQQQDQIEIEIHKQAPREGTSQKLLTYSILVKNQSSTPAFDVQVHETISPTASLVDLSPPAEVKENQLTWKIARLEPGEERELLVKVFPNQEGSVQTSSAVRLASNVTSATQISAPELALQVDGPENVTAGEIFALDFVVSNQGTLDQKDIQLNLDLPAELSHDQGRQLTFKIAQLAANETRRLRARVKAVKTGQVTSQAALLLQGQSMEEAALQQNVSTPQVAAPQPQQKAPVKQSPATPATTPVTPAVPAPNCVCQPPVYPVYYVPAPWLVP